MKVWVYKRISQHWETDESTKNNPYCIYLKLGEEKYDYIFYILKKTIPHKKLSKRVINDMAQLCGNITSNKITYLGNKSFVSGTFNMRFELVYEYSV